MDARLLHLINDYQAAVRSAVSLMEQSGMARPVSALDWAVSSYKHIKELVGGIPFFKHGYGIAVHLREGCVDFDFGAEGQIDGFNSARLSHFAKGRLSKYGFTSKKEMEIVFLGAVGASQLIYSGYILYYLPSPNT